MAPGNAGAWLRSKTHFFCSYGLRQLVLSQGHQRVQDVLQNYLVLDVFILMS